ncbi:MAG: 50S ribosomal protein L11 methyltransferase [Armatimonadota bacterium]
MRWAEIEVVVTEEAADLVANILIEEGCGGAAIKGPSVRASGPHELSDHLPADGPTVLTAYLPVDDRLEVKLDNICDRVRALPETGVDIGLGEINVKRVDDADWASAWKSFFKAVEIGKVLIKPSWEDVETKPEQVIVEIDPGMAFGTGNHPTTQLCMLALQKYIKGGERVLDVGTGSGVLAIAAAKLGASEVYSTENDSVAMEAAVENVRRNGVDNRLQVELSESPSSVPGQFDLVVANITATIILGMAEDIVNAAKPGGLLITSGLIESRSDEVTGRLRGLGFEMVEKGVDDEWVILVMRKKQ